MCVCVCVCVCLCVCVCVCVCVLACCQAEFFASPPAATAARGTVGKECQQLQPRVEQWARSGAGCAVLLLTARLQMWCRERETKKGDANLLAAMSRKALASSCCGREFGRFTRNLQRLVVVEVLDTHVCISGSFDPCRGLRCGYVCVCVLYALCVCVVCAVCVCVLCVCCVCVCVVCVCCVCVCVVCVLCVCVLCVCCVCVVCVVCVCVVCVLCVCCVCVVCVACCVCVYVCGCCVFCVVCCVLCVVCCVCCVCVCVCACVRACVRVCGGLHVCVRHVC